MTNVVHVCISPSFAGSEMYCTRLAAAQIAAGHEVSVIVRNGGAAYNTRFAWALGAGRLIIVPRFYPRRLLFLAIAAVVRRRRPDIVHSHLGTAAREVGKAQAFGRFAHVASLHMKYKDGDYRRCHVLICVASWQAEAAKDFPGLVAVVRNWVPETPPTAPAVSARLRAELGFSADVFVAGSVGRLVKVKGFDCLVQAFREAFPHGDEKVGLVVVGEGQDRAAFEALAAGDARIHFPGDQANIAPWLGMFDAYVSSARWEGLSLAVLEAAGAALPLILTDIDGNREFFDLQAPGLVCVTRPGDAASLSDALQGSAAAGRRRVTYDLTEFSEAKSVAKIDTLYDALLASRCRGRTRRSRPAGG